MSEPSRNQQLLDEVNAAGLWFAASKTRPIWARKLDEPQKVRTREGVQDAPAGSYLCRGKAGDVWPQSAERLETKYAATDEVSPDGWRKYTPRPEEAGVMAARIDHAFEVQADWGTLAGEPGDFLVKSDKDRKTSYPTDVWVVGAALFQSTYEATT